MKDTRFATSPIPVCVDRVVVGVDAVTEVTSQRILKYESEAGLIEVKE